MIRAMLLTAVLVVVTAVAMSGRGPSWAEVRDVGDRIIGAQDSARQVDTAPPGDVTVPPPASAPVQRGPMLPANPDGLHRWSQFPTHYCIDETQLGFTSNAEFQRLTDEAFTAWGVPVVDDGACAHASVAGDHINEIGWGTPPGAPPPGSRVTEAGVTLTSYSECTSNCGGQSRVSIIEADIIIARRAPREFQTEACLYSTLLHETGHFLGLEHLPAPSVMQAETSQCLTELTPTDLAALVARYGLVATPQPDLFGR